MSKQKTRSLTILALTGLILSVGKPSHASENSQAGVCIPNYIPTVIVGNPKSPEYIQPICSKCRLVAERQDQQTSAPQAMLELTYVDEVYLDFEGTIELTVLLPNDTRDTLTITDVSLDEGEVAGWALDAKPQWTWDEVELVWLEMHPMNPAT